MRNNPWIDNKPFDVMFNETIVIKNNGKNNTSNQMSVPACIFPIEDAEIMSDIDYDTSIKVYSILVSKSCDNIKMKIGDKVITPYNKSELRITNIEDEQVWIRITVRTK